MTNPIAAVAVAALTSAHFHRATAPNESAANPYYEAAGSPARGYVHADLLRSGTLANGSRVLAIPLLSGGSGGAFFTLVFAVSGKATHFAGYISSPNGHLRVSVARGALIVTKPIYLSGDAQCCPEHEESIIYSVEHGRLRQLSEKKGPATALGMPPK